MKYLVKVFVLLLAGCNSSEQPKITASDDLQHILYSGGDIITMSDDSHLEYAEAVVTSNDIILFVGSKTEADTKYPDAKHHSLNGKTMMPGFIEPHVHPSLAATILPNEIIAPYDWVLPDRIQKGVSSHEEYISRLSSAISERASPREIFFVWGYHELWHGELSRSLLNELAREQPIAIIHRSFHEIFLNDATINALGISEKEFRANPQVDWDKGHFYEGGWMALAPKMAPLLLDGSRYMRGLGLMTELIKKNGITTIAEPGFPNINFNGEYALLKQEMDTNPPYDVYLIPNGTQLSSMKGSDENALEFIKTLPTFNTNNITFLPNQVKLFSDGAIYSQAMQMIDGYTDGHHGEWMTPLNVLQKQISLYWNSNFKIHVHANGDKGIQQVLDFVSADQKKYPRLDHRLTFHHMGYFTDSIASQIDDMEIEASVNPFYLWALADKYADHGLGTERAENLVPINSLASRDISTSYHSDFAMAPLEPLTLAWTAINRVTSSNKRISQNQRVDLYTAMQAITIAAAKTLNLENSLGSIEIGKIANFTILNRNPFKIDTILIKEIEVLGTVYRGNLSLR
ncbi:MAG: amidohydrolase family protein [Porticoccaceae bacterium]|nr:amidohydrolase family protein [Porticoccaceae bacterium]